MADRRRVTVSTPRGPFEVEVSALLPQTDLSVEVAPAADSEEPQRQRRPLDYAQLPSDEEEEHGLDQRGGAFVSRAELEAIRAERDHLRRQLSSLSSADEPALDSRALRQTAPTKNLMGGLYFTPDGRSLVHGGHEDKELSLWDLRTAKRTVGLERTGGIICSAISPDGSRLPCTRGLTMG